MPNGKELRKALVSMLLEDTLTPMGAGDESEKRPGLVSSQLGAMKDGFVGSALDGGEIVENEPTPFQIGMEEAKIKGQAQRGALARMSLENFLTGGMSGLSGGMDYEDEGKKGEDWGVRAVKATAKASWSGLKWLGLQGKQTAQSLWEARKNKKTKQKTEGVRVTKPGRPALTGPSGEEDIIDGDVEEVT